MEDIRVSFITYNVGTSNPEQSLLEMLGLPSNPKNDRSRSDLYVVGFQEVKSQPQNIFIDAIYNDPWTRAVQEILASRAYIKLKTIRLQGLVLSLFCRRRLLLEIRDVETTYVRTGLAGMWGNKGAVGIRISISGCSLCFVNAHLSAHESQIQNRIKDYNDILKGVKFHDPITEDMFSHDYIFWMGDLNFRLRDDFTAEFSEIDNMIRKGDLKTLFQYDELQQIMREGVGLHEFSEGHPDFAPTFKFKVGSQEYDDKRKQAWTDRILYKVNERNYDNVILKAELVKDSYRSHPFYLLSDHKPVTADFVLKVFANYSDTYVLFERIESWVEEQDNVVTFEVTKEFPLSKNDWIGAYREDFSSIEDYLCYEYVSKGFSPLPAACETHLVNTLPTISSALREQSHPSNKIIVEVVIGQEARLLRPTPDVCALVADTHAPFRARLVPVTSPGLRSSSFTCTRRRTMSLVSWRAATRSLY